MVWKLGILWWYTKEFLIFFWGENVKVAVWSKTKVRLARYAISNYDHEQELWEEEESNVVLSLPPAFSGDAVCLVTLSKFLLQVHSAVHVEMLGQWQLLACYMRSCPLAALSCVHYQCHTCLGLVLPCFTVFLTNEEYMCLWRSSWGSWYFWWWNSNISAARSRGNINPLSPDTTRTNSRFL